MARKKQQMPERTDITYPFRSLTNLKETLVEIKEQMDMLSVCLSSSHSEHEGDTALKCPTVTDLESVNEKIANLDIYNALRHLATGKRNDYITTGIAPATTPLIEPLFGNEMVQKGIEILQRAATSHKGARLVKPVEMYSEDIGESPGEDWIDDFEAGCVDSVLTAARIAIDVNRMHLEARIRDLERAEGFIDKATGSSESEQVKAMRDMLLEQVRPTIEEIEIVSSKLQLIRPLLEERQEDNPLLKMQSCKRFDTIKRVFDGYFEQDNIEVPSIIFGNTPAEKRAQYKDIIETEMMGATTPNGMQHIPGYIDKLEEFLLQPSSTLDTIVNRNELEGIGKTDMGHDIMDFEEQAATQREIAERLGL